MTQAAPFLFYSPRPRTKSYDRTDAARPSNRQAGHSVEAVLVVVADVIKVPHVAVGVGGGRSARVVSHVTRSDHLCRHPIGLKLRESHNGRSVGFP